MKCGAGEPVAGKDRLTFRLAHRDMPDQSLGREKYLFQSMALHVLARGRVGAGHDKAELGAVIAAAVRRRLQFLRDRVLWHGDQADLSDHLSGR